jgi:ABC-type Fe3+ transport system substrate-binding protein
MIRQLISTTALAALALSGAAYGQGTGGKGKAWDDLVKAAQREGEVSVILSGQMPQKLRPVMPEFEKKYGIKVNYQTGSGRKHAERILAERRLGRYTVDGWIGGANTPLIQLIPNGALAPVSELLADPDVKDPSNWFQGKHHYTDTQNRYIYTWGASPTQNVSFNTNMVNPGEIKSYHDLLDPKWKGKIVSWSPGKQGSGASVIPLVLDEDIGYEWFRRWANEMDVTVVDDARQGAEWVALGRFPIGMFGLNTQADVLAEQGFPIQGWLPHPMKEVNILSSSAANLMALDRAPHPNALKLFVNWVLSRETQQLIIKTANDIDSLRTDVDNSVIDKQYRIQPGAEYYIAFEDPEYVNRQTEIIENLRKIMREAGYR